MIAKTLNRNTKTGADRRPIMGYDLNVEKATRLGHLFSFQEDFLFIVKPSWNLRSAFMVLARDTTVQMIVKKNRSIIRVICINMVFNWYQPISIILH